MNSEDSRLFTKSENTDLAQNLGHLLDTNTFPKSDTKLVLLFTEIMAENDKNITQENLEILNSKLIHFVFKHMHEIPIEDLAMTLPFLEGTDSKKAEKFI